MAIYDITDGPQSAHGGELDIFSAANFALSPALIPGVAPQPPIPVELPDMYVGGIDWTPDDSGFDWTPERVVVPHPTMPPSPAPLPTEPPPTTLTIYPQLEIFKSVDADDENVYVIPELEFNFLVTVSTEEAPRPLYTITGEGSVVVDLPANFTGTVTVKEVGSETHWSFDSTVHNFIFEDGISEGVSVVTAAFTNTYTRQAERAEIVIVKTVETEGNVPHFAPMYFTFNVDAVWANGDVYEIEPVTIFGQNNRIVELPLDFTGTVTVTEVNTGAADWAFDPTVWVFNFDLGNVVGTSADGNPLEISTNAAHFTNVYNRNSYTPEILIVKYVQAAGTVDAPALDDEFEFEVTINGTPQLVTIDGQGSETVTLPLDFTGTVTVRELGEAPANWTFDDTVWTFTFARGVLTSVNGSDVEEETTVARAAFVNIYDRESVAPELVVVKAVDTLGNVEVAPGYSFEFEITINGEAQTFELYEDGQWRLVLDYDFTGTVTIRELGEELANWGFVTDTQVLEFNRGILVEEGEVDGVTVVSLEDVITVTFTNTYDRDSFAPSLLLRKIVESAGNVPAPVNMTFEFEVIVEGEDEPRRYTLTDNDYTYIGDLPFDFTGTVTVREIGEAPANWTFDTATQTFNFVNGLLQSTKTNPGLVEAEFTNVYDRTSISPVLMLSKIVATAENAVAPELTFTFEVTVEGEVAPRFYTITGSGSYSVRLPFDFTGTVSAREIPQELENWVFDTNVEEFTFVRGVLQSGKTNPDALALAEFTNIYTPTPEEPTVVEPTPPAPPVVEPTPEEPTVTEPTPEAPSVAAPAPEAPETPEVAGRRGMNASFIVYHFEVPFGTDVSTITRENVYGFRMIEAAFVPSNVWRVDLGYDNEPIDENADRETLQASTYSIALNILASRNNAANFEGLDEITFVSDVGFRRSPTSGAPDGTSYEFAGAVGYDIAANFTGFPVGYNNIVFYALWQAPEVLIEDMEVPLAAFPIMSYTYEEELIDIEPLEVPLASMPQTGVESNLTLFVVGLITSAITAIALFFYILKKRNEEMQ
jgi:LPXTG-motif cell wall-anchored protein